jgi:putative ABC transport system permease protein
VQIGLEGDPRTDTRMWSFCYVDYDFLSTLGIRLARGRGFSRDFPSDTASSVMINEAAARELGAGDPVGRRIRIGGLDSTYYAIVGVVKDFHFASLRQKIEPLAIAVNENPTLVTTVKIKAGAFPQAMVHIERVWKSVYPDQPFVSTFLEDEFNKAYRGDINFTRIGNAFSALAVLIACLGLYGLASHTTEQRRKEIGIRKVLGASVLGISRLLILDYVRWVVLATLFAWPVAYLVAQRWLGGFAYHTTITWIPFVLAGVLGLLIAVLTVLGHAVKAALANPVDSLHYE